MSLFDIDVTLGGQPTCQATITDFQLALREGMAFSAGTGLTQITPTQALNQVFSNPAGSGKNAIVVLRAFYNSARTGEASLKARFIPSPEPLVGADQVTPSNLKTGGQASGMEFWSQVSADRLDRDQPIADPTGFILPVGGHVFKIETPRLVAPGESFGFYVYGGTDDVDVASINYVWYEEDV